MLNPVKNFILKNSIRILNKLPPFDLVKKIHHWFTMTYLFRTDRVRWNVLRARELGARVGNNCRFYSLNFFSEPYLIEIGDDVIISGEVFLVTHDGGVFLLKEEIKNLRGHYGRIRIGNNCFIGMGAIILPNVSIGNNCIIGAGAVVNRSFPDDCVIMGNPADIVFKTPIYLKMRKHSPFTLSHDQYPFPQRIPEDIKRKMLVEYFADKQIR